MPTATTAIKHITNLHFKISKVCVSIKICITLPDMVYWEEWTHLYEIRINPNLESDPDKTFLRFRKLYSWLFHLPLYFEDLLGWEAKKPDQTKKQRYTGQSFSKDLFLSYLVQIGKLDKIWKKSKQKPTLNPGLKTETRSNDFCI